MLESEERPWGSYEVLQAEPHYKLKRITVNCGKRLSLQSHGKRDELWTIVGGKGIAEVDGLEIIVHYGDTVDIRRGQKHRMTNTGNEPLIYIEVQTGEYFGEDDIVRYQDDFGRDIV
jgi:mannose-6-phosphate isomerase-like protein (cupin superfamily)